MLVRFTAEYPGGVRTVAGEALDCADVDAAYRECKRRLDARPRAHRIEGWTSAAFGQRDYVTRACRGVEVKHSPTCVDLCCIVTAKDEDETKGDDDAPV